MPTSGWIAFTSAKQVSAPAYIGGYENWDTPYSDGLTEDGVTVCASVSAWTAPSNASAAASAPSTWALLYYQQAPVTGMVTGNVVSSLKIRTKLSVFTSAGVTAVALKGFTLGYTLVSGTDENYQSFNGGAISFSTASPSSLAWVTAEFPWGFLSPTYSELSAYRVLGPNFGLQVNLYFTPLTANATAGLGRFGVKIDSLQIQYTYGPPVYVPDINSAEYDHEIKSLTFSKNINALSSEYDHEIKALGLTQNHVFKAGGVQSSEYGHEIKSAAISQNHVFKAGSIQSSEYDFEIQAGFPNFLFTVMINNNEYDHEILGDINVTSTGWVVFPDQTGNEYGHEIRSARLRYFRNGRNLYIKRVRQD